MALQYGEREFAFANPIATALSGDASFRAWFLARTRFASRAENAILISDEMKATRSPGATTWWRSHWRAGCECSGCAGGQETDLLAIFQDDAGYRFALHCEVKQPKDRFPTNKDQAANYRVRAACWASGSPKSVPQHDDADTVLLCSERRLADYAVHLPKFGSVITFEQILSEFPAIWGSPDHAIHRVLG